MTTPTPAVDYTERDRLLMWAWIEDGMPWDHEVLSAVGRQRGMTNQGVRDAARERFGDSS